MKIDVTVKDTASAAIAELMGKISSKRLNVAAGASAARLVQNHFGKLDEDRANKLGGKRTHFFASAARGTTYAATDTGAEVNIHKLGIRLQLEGGTVKPVSKKYLTIPARAEAHGKRAGEFDNLEIMWGRSGPIGLMERRGRKVSIKKDKATGEMNVGRGRKFGGGVFFWLVKSATMKPDPEIVPTDQDLAMAVKLGIYSYLNRRAS